jgi:hypothetical protein
LITRCSEGARSVGVHLILTRQVVRTRDGNASFRSLREDTPSFMKNFRRCHSTVRTDSTASDRHAWIPLRIRRLGVRIPPSAQQPGFIAWRRPGA